VFVPAVPATSLYGVCAGRIPAAPVMRTLVCSPTPVAAVITGTAMVASTAVLLMRTRTEVVVDAEAVIPPSVTP